MQVILNDEEAKVYLDFIKDNGLSEISSVMKKNKSLVEENESYKEHLKDYYSIKENANDIMIATFGDIASSAGLSARIINSNKDKPLFEILKEVIERLKDHLDSNSLS